jgi:predicted NAD/FAD-binding protein
MDYRRRYLRRLANQNQQNKAEEKPAQETTEEKQNQNVYLQKFLEKKKYSKWFNNKYIIS